MKLIRNLTRRLARGWALPVLLLLPGCDSVDPPYVLIERLAVSELEFDERAFRSERGDGRLSDQVTFGRETRRAIVPPLPSRLWFDVEVPEDAVLRFSTAVGTAGSAPPPDHVDFRVIVDDGGSERRVFETTVHRREPNRWREHEVALSKWSGERVRIALDTSSRRRAAGGEMLPYWGNPVLASRSRNDERPDLILISLDCVRADHLGAYGYRRDTSPRLDELAREAVLFEKAVSVSSFTHPTHLAMLTGLPPSIHGVSRWRKPDASVDYLPEILSRAGFRASGIVSGPLLTQSFGFERGFDYFRAFHDTTRARVLANTALRVLERGRGQPQFLFLHFFDAHLPYWPPEEFTTRFGPRPENASRLIDKVREQIPPDGPRDVQQTIDLYDGEIAYLDREVGRFLDELKKRGFYDDALILVTADHGEAFFEHGFWEHGQTLYEEMVHVPLVVKWPGERRTGRVENLVSQTDIFPTLLEAAGLPPSGEGLPLSLYLGEDAPADRAVVLELTWDPLETRNARMLVGWRDERYKYLASLEAPTVDDLYTAPILEEELYDLASDPGETIDLADERPDETAARRKHVLAYLSRARELRGKREGPEVTLDEELLERLRALGYLR